MLSAHASYMESQRYSHGHGNPQPPALLKHYYYPQIQVHMSREEDDACGSAVLCVPPNEYLPWDQSAAAVSARDAARQERHGQIHSINGDQGRNYGIIKKEEWVEALLLMSSAHPHSPAELFG